MAAHVAASGPDDKPTIARTSASLEPAFTNVSDPRLLSDALCNA
jgi:hypothetical protein